MKFQLRDYQLRGNQMLRKSISEGNKKVLYWAQTGAGKGLVMANLAKSALDKSKKVLTVMRRRELIFQTQENYKNYYGINASIIMGQEKGFNPDSPVQICSIDTVRSRMDKLEFIKNYELIIIDEAHDTTSPSYQKLFEFLGDKIYIGFTATPFCIGNKRLEFWDTFIKPIEAHELRDQNYLVPARVFAPAKMDLTGIKKVSTGDYNNKQLFAMASDSKIVGDIVETWQKYGVGATVLFAVNKAHSKLMAHAFREAGIPATHIDESHNSAERKKAVADLKSGKISILCNVNIFSTGIDIPQILTIILARPTASEVLYIQQVGRGLRTFQGKEYCIILDHAGNSIDRFGLPYDVRQAAVGEGSGFKNTPESDPTSSSKQCPECFAILEKNEKECLYCGAELKRERVVENVSGELVELESTPKVLKFKKFKTELDKLTQLTKTKGFKPNWKYFKLYDRFGMEIYEFEKELGLPGWIPKYANKDEQIQPTSKTVEIDIAQIAKKISEFKTI